MSAQSPVIADQPGPPRGSSRPVRISVLSPAHNEEENVRRCVDTVRRVVEALGPGYEYEHVFGDNCSTDKTLEILKHLAAEDPHIKILAYSRNFGAEKSGMTLLRHATGDVVFGLPSDLQEPPEMLPVFLEKWREGYEVVYGTYENPHERWLRRRLRRIYYWLVDKVSPDPLPRNFSGFALIDRVVVDEVVKVDDFAPYVRGIIATVGFKQISVPYQRRPREAGESKHNLGFLLSFATNGLITHSMVPLRLITLSGFLFAGTSILLALLYAAMKLVNWSFQAPGATTTVVLVLFFSGIQLLFLGILGEYIGAIHSQVRRRPFVIIREKVNFGPEDEGRAPRAPGSSPR